MKSKQSENKETTMNQLNADELFQIIGEQTYTIRKQGQEIIRLQQEVTDSKPKEEKEMSEVTIAKYSRWGGYFTC